MSYPPRDRAEAPRERAEPREMAALKALAEAQPELAPAVALEREIVDGERRLQRRLGTPWLDVSNDDLTARLARGERLIEWAQLGIDWPEFRLRLRQVVDVLRRHDILDAADAARLHDIGRDPGLPAIVERWYDEGAHGGPAADTSLTDVLGLTVRPFLTRAAEVVQQRVSTDTWPRGTCPMCGARPGFAVVAAPGVRHLVCGRCHGRWLFDARTCPRCLSSDRQRVFSAHDGVYQVAVCDACKRYVKAIDVKKAGRPLLMSVDTVATLALDQAIAAQGFEAD
ncbi:MAG: formate dehydrogenase accessory protein FdhE [Acidobacteria bacterium]|nr:formate dehydrogenase accessory protein FdhE [Acidobacteriota bacterium]